MALAKILKEAEIDSYAKYIVLFVGNCMLLNVTNRLMWICFQVYQSQGNRGVAYHVFQWLNRNLWDKINKIKIEFWPKVSDDGLSVELSTFTHFSPSLL